MSSSARRTADAFIPHLRTGRARHKQKWEKIEDNRLADSDFEILPAGGLAARTRALLKVEDGCNNFCSYCIIPYARGRVRSMPLDAAVAEAQKLAAEGYREIVINGIEISSWGQEWKDGSRPARPARGHLRRRAGGAHPPRLARAADDRRGVLPRAGGLSESLPAVPPEPPERQRHASCAA